ncbi:MAG TPA: TonB-dependent receptor [Longimicrobiales bacterium]
MRIVRRRVSRAGLLGAIAGVLLLPAAGAPQEAGSAVIHGFVREAQSGEPIPEAVVSVADGSRRVATDRHGYFSIRRLPPGPQRVLVRALGYAPVDTTVIAAPDAPPIQLLLFPAPLPISGVTATVDPPPKDPEVSVEVVTPTEIRSVPAALEADLFRSIQALPGVIGPNILSSRLLVRGGSADENLFLLDGYPVLYPHHLAGAFSAFHVEAVQDAQLWLAAPPARYGGRLSSVLDIQLREGNRRELTGAASLGLVTSSMIVEGPHGHGAWFVGARRTYLDYLLRGPNVQVGYYFYDLYGKTYADLSAADRVSALIFFGRDRAWRERTDVPESDPFDPFQWSNLVAGIAWRRLLGGRGTFEQRVSFSRFAQTLIDGESARQHADVETDHAADLVSLRGELRLEASARHTVEAGYAVDWMRERHRTAYDWEFVDTVHAVERRAASEAVTYSAYLQDDVLLTGDLRVRLGLRAEASGAYRSLQPRVGARYRLSDRVDLTAGAGLLRQYVHLLQDPDVELASVYSVDIWLSAHEPGVTAGRATHLVAGLEAQLPLGLRFRAEAYEKRYGGLLTIAPYDPAYRIPAIHRLEDADGLARGLDLSLGREGAEDLRGWIGYSIAASRRTVADATFPADPHPRQRLVAVLDARRNDRWRVTGRLEAREGVPYTPALGILNHRAFDFGLRRFGAACNTTMIEFLYGARNAERTGWSKQLDVGAHYRWKDRRGWTWDLSLSILNLLFDQLGVFRPADVEFDQGCNGPIPVQREPELELPAIPSVALRVEF